jgi:hypothetical protein
VPTGRRIGPGTDGGDDEVTRLAWTVLRTYGGRFSAEDDASCAELAGAPKSPPTKADSVSIPPNTIDTPLGFISRKGNRSFVDALGVASALFRDLTA